MKLNFKTIKIHNFMSIGEAELDLSNRGYVLVSGRNENPVDNASSNGSGKSSLFEAISYALTKETVRGSSDIVNMYADDGAYVDITFQLDNKEYRILRSKNHSEYKTDLKIWVNGEDKSGKGLRESEQILADLIPDMTSILVGSVIILGQGLPYRLTNNTPAGRKAVLEQLTKSDFMIEDLKRRVGNRKDKINSILREQEDLNLKHNTQIELLKTQLETDEKKLSELVDDGYDIKISQAELETAHIDGELNKSIVEYTKISNEIDRKREQYVSMAGEMATATQKALEEAQVLSNTDIIAKYPTREQVIASYPDRATIRAKYPSKDTITAKYPDLPSIQAKYPTIEQINKEFDVTDKVTKKMADLFTMDKEITELTAKALSLKTDIETKDAIKDVCPTCGQRLQNVTKPDTTTLKDELKELNDVIYTKRNAFTLLKSEVDLIESEANKKIDDKINLIRGQVDADWKASQDALQKELADVEQKTEDEVAQNEKLISKKLDEVTKAIQEEQKIAEAKAEEIKAKVKLDYDEKLSSITQEGTELKAQLAKVETEKFNLSEQLSKAKVALEKLKLDKQTYITTHKQLEDSVSITKANIEELTNKILYNTKEIEKWNEHLQVVTKFDTHLKRDFRGYLLSNIIDYIDRKVKAYSKDVFGTEKASIALVGNNIEISYNEKPYENLSGGEKQKIDLITQFAIRDMMCNCLDFSSNILVIDEIFDNLDAIGYERVINLISTRLTDVSSIFIVTHRRDIEIPYDSEIVVVKSSEGVSTVY